MFNANKMFVLGQPVEMKNLQLKTMRDVFIEQIYNKMKYDETIVFISADFGAPALDKIREEFSDRFINVGIAEQNLINLAVGFALEEFTVYVYAIAPFLTMRAYEQIRVNLSIMSQLKEINVNLIGVGAGLSYDVSGPTHHCIEDISIMRLLPNFVVFSPSDWILAEKFIDFSLNVKKPKYMRFDAKPVPQVYNEINEKILHDGCFELSKGDKVCIVSTGYMTHTALEVMREFKEKKIEIGVIDVFLLTNINEELLFNYLKNFEYIITLEEALINRGGLDNLVLNILNDKDCRIKLKPLGFKNTYVFDVGSRNYLHKLNRLDKENIVEVIKKYLVS